MFINASGGWDGSTRSGRDRWNDGSVMVHGPIPLCFATSAPPSSTDWHIASTPASKWNLVPLHIKKHHSSPPLSVETMVGFAFAT